MKAKFALIFILFLVLIQSSYALGISPPKIEVAYEPGAQHTFSFTIYGAKMSEVDVLKRGELKDYATIREIDLLSDGFTVDFIVPQIEKPGRHSVEIGAGQRPSGGQGVAAVVAVFARIDVRVPYPGKYLDAALDVNDVRVGEPAQFTVTLISRGKEVISHISGSVAVLDLANRTVATILLSSAQNIQPEQEFELVGQWDTTGALPSPYKAIANITYDESFAQAEKAFKVGDILIKIVKIDAPNVTKGAIGKISIGVESKWNEPIENVKGNFIIKNGAQEIATVNTPTITVSPWNSHTLEAYWDTANVNIGQYDVLAKVYYADKTAEASTKINVIEQEKIFATNTELLIIMGLIVMVAILVFKYYNKKKKSAYAYRW